MRTKTLYIISAIILFLFLAQSAFAQNMNTTQSLLMGKDWVCQFPSKQEYIFAQTFTKDTIIVSSLGSKAMRSSYDAYYLSDSITHNFDTLKIGKISNGKYIISKNSLNKSILILEIIKLTNTSLELKNVEKSANSLLKWVAF